MASFGSPSEFENEFGGKIYNFLHEFILVNFVKMLIYWNLTKNAVFAPVWVWLGKGFATLRFAFGVPQGIQS